MRLAKKTRALSKIELKVASIDIAAIQVRFRANLLLLFEEDVWRVFGYATFPEYCQDRLGITYTTSYIYNLLKVARCERTCNLSPGPSVQ